MLLDRLAWTTPTWTNAGVLGNDRMVGAWFGCGGHWLGSPLPEGHDMRLLSLLDVRSGQWHLTAGL